MIRTNPFQQLYNRCNSGTNVDKSLHLYGGPTMVDIEPVGLCNFRCVMCPTGLGSLGRPSGFMERDTWRAIIDKTDPFMSAIRFIGWGEPLMHPKIVDMVQEAHERQRLTHINTNGSKLTPELMTRLMLAGLSSIKFSFQGVDRESYKAMRRIDFFDDLIDLIAMTRETRDTLNADTFIQVSTSITTESPETVEDFRFEVEQLADHVNIGHTIFEFIDMAAVPPNRRAQLEKAAAEQVVTKQHPKPCPEVFDKLTIHWDGAVRVCCNDYSGKTDLGNVVTDEMADIWEHPQMEAYRKRLEGDDYSGPLCSVCFDYMNLTEENKV